MKIERWKFDSFSDLGVSDMKNDVEKKLKEFLNSPEASEGLHLTRDELKTLYDRVVDYRQRIHKKQQQCDMRMAPIQSELADYRQSRQWARDRLDPEKKRTGYSYLDQIEIALLIEEIEKRRGHLVAQRLIWGQMVPEDLLIETIGVLTAAVDDARHEEQRWRRYLKEEQERRLAK